MPTAGQRGADQRGVVRARARTARGGAARRARTCAAPRACAGRRRGRLAIGATEPLLGTRVLGPTVVMPGSGGGPSHGATMRASTPSSRSARASPSTWPCTPPNSDSEYGHDSMTLRRGCPSPRRDHPTPERAGGRVGAAVARPVGLQQVPVLGRDPDQVLEAVREVLGDPGDVVAEAARPLGRDRRADARLVARRRAEVAPGREQRRAAAQREHRRAAGQRGALAEELDLDAVAGEVAVGRAGTRPRCRAAPASTSVPAVGDERDHPHPERAHASRRTTRTARAARPARRPR